MREAGPLLVALLDEAGLSIDEFSRACSVESGWIESRVREGLLPGAGDAPEMWRFTSVHVRRAIRMRRVERDFDAVPELAALVVDLIEEVESLRERLR